MSDTRPPADRPSPDEEQLRRWLGEAGPRPDPGAERTQRVHAAVQAAWRRAVDARRRRRRRTGLALAAALLLAAVLGTVGVRRGWIARSPDVVASAERVAGVVLRAPAGHGSVERLARGGALRIGDVVETATDGAVAVTYEDGATVRIAPRSRVVLEDRRSVRLEHGRAYVDSGHSPGQAGFLISTSHGTVQDVGTRFLVSVTTDELGVWVRDGRVRIRAPAAGGDLLVDAGRFVEIPARGEPRHGTVGPADPIWEWTERVAPPFDLEGASFERFILWVSRETGLRVRWADEDVLTRARETVMHGSIGDLAPRDALKVVQTTGFAVRLEDDRLVVGRTQAPGRAREGAPRGAPAE